MAASNMSLSWIVLLKGSETACGGACNEMVLLEVCYEVTLPVRQSLRRIQIFTEATTQPLTNATQSEGTSSVHCEW